MSLWCDKYRPAKLSKLDFNKDQANSLKMLVQSDDFPHLLIYGPSGSGKKTRIHCILKEIFGSTIDKLLIEHQTYETPSKRKVEIRTVASNYHIEVNPSDVGIHDRVVIQELIKATASTHTLSEKVAFKVIVITEADKLTKDAQQALRRTMEKYMSVCRLILTGETSSRIIPAIKSRCLMVRIPAPSIQVISNVIQTVSQKEAFQITPELAIKIAEASDRNLRRALLMAEAMKVQNSKQITRPQWYEFTKRMAEKMLKNQSPRQLEEVRADFYELWGHLIPSELIFRVVLEHLLPGVRGPLKAKTIKMAAYYEHKLRLGSKDVIHFEAFAAHFMAALKKSLEEKNKIIDIDMEDEALLMY